MIDTIVATVTSSSTERLPAGVRDHDVEDLDRLAASLDGLALYCGELSVDEAGKQITCESISQRQRFSEAASVHRKQL